MNFWGCYQQRPAYTKQGLLLLATLKRHVTTRDFLYQCGLKTPKEYKQRLIHIRTYCNLHSIQNVYYVVSYALNISICQKWSIFMVFLRRRRLDRNSEKKTFVLQSVWGFSQVCRPKNKGFKIAKHLTPIFCIMLHHSTQAQ